VELVKNRGGCGAGTVARKRDCAAYGPGEVALSIETVANIVSSASWLLSVARPVVCG